MYAIFEDGSRHIGSGRFHSGGRLPRDRAGADAGVQSRAARFQWGRHAIGQPLVAGAKVVAEVVDLPTKKTVIQHFRRRKNYRRLKGHTQPYVRVKIKDIVKV